MNAAYRILVAAIVALAGGPTGLDRTLVTTTGHPSQRLVDADAYRVSIAVPCDRAVRLDLAVTVSSGVRLRTPAGEVAGLELKRGWTGFTLPATRRGRLEATLTAPQGTRVVPVEEASRLLCAGRVDRDTLVDVVERRFSRNRPGGALPALVSAALVLLAALALALVGRKATTARRGSTAGRS